MRRTLRTLAIVLLAAPLLAAGAGTAAADRFDLSIGSTSRWMHDPSIDTLTADSSNAAFSLGVGYRLGEMILPGLDLYLEAGFEHSSFAGTSFQQIDSDVGITGGSIGARASYLLPRLRSHAAVFARAALGTSRVTLTLSDYYSGTDPTKDWDWTSTGHLGGGIDLYAIRKQAAGGGLAGLGLRLEAGYTRFGAVDLDAIPEHASGDPDAITIPTASAPLGSLNVSAWTFSVGLLGRF